MAGSRLVCARELRRAVQRSGFKPHRLMIGANAAQFMIHNVVINQRSQFATAARRSVVTCSAPATYLLDTMLAFESLQAGQPATIVVEYVGPDPAGEAFDAVMIGSIEPHADTEISYHHALLDAVMAAPEALREQLAQHCGVRLPAATLVAIRALKPTRVRPASASRGCTDLTHSIRLAKDLVRCHSCAHVKQFAQFA